MTETWKPVVGASRYEVSDLGRVRSLGSRARILSLSPNSAGYLVVGITFNDGRSTSRTVMSLVAEAFIGEKPEGMRVKPRNGVKTDCRLENLVYSTPKAAPGEVHTLSKFSYLQTKAIRALYATGEFSQPDLAEVFGVSHSTINKIVRT